RRPFAGAPPARNGDAPFPIGAGERSGGRSLHRVAPRAMFRRRGVMTLATWLLFCATETILCFTPGPAVLLVVSIALTRGAGAGLGASVGILAANAFYFL